MSETLRTAAAPIDHLLAEITAYPLASEAAFRLSLTELDFQLRGPSAALWRDAENSLLRSNPGVSLDEIVAIRDRVWYSNHEPRRKQSLHEFLHRIASTNLEARGAAAVPVALETCTTGKSPAAARSRQAWRWMSFALPSDLLLAGLWSKDASPVTVELQIPQMIQNLQDHGFAETHLHIGAALRFSLLWVATLNHLADPAVKATAFQSPGAAFDEGRNLAGWLLRAALARYLLAAFLRSRTQGRKTDLRGYLTNVASPKLNSTIYTTATTAFEICLRELARGRFAEGGPTFGDLRDIYAQLTKLRARPFPKEKDQVPFRDPIAGMYRPSIGLGATSEMLFVAESLKYLDRCNEKSAAPPDHDFATLFWQTIRIRCLYFRHIVQRPMTPGLQWFIRTYGRIKVGRTPLSTRTLVQSAIDVCGIQKGLRSLEVRTSPSNSISSLYQWIQEATNAFHNGVPSAGENNCQFGIVMHLTKLRSGGFEEGVPRPNWSGTNADPSNSSNGKYFRYSQYFENKRQETVALSRVLSSFPGMLQVVRGFDICTDELGVPSWVLSPLIRYLHDTGQIASSFLSNTLGRHIPPPRYTIHVGEDFVHLLGGLRAVAEAIGFFHLNEGDRIGHGVALGIDASAWAQRTGRIPVSREQRMLDLTWEWSCYTREDVRFNPARRAYIEDNIERLSAEIFGSSLRARPGDIVELVKDLHNEQKLRRMGFPTGNSTRRKFNAARDQRLLLYLTSPTVFRNGQITEWVTPDAEANALETLQTHVRAHVASIGVAVEVNPSSNLLIGNLGDLRRHPLWRLRPPFFVNSPRLRVCIGSDDPITFNTCLPDEYTLLHDALVLAGLSSDDADDWIDHARKAGIASRFTLENSDSYTRFVSAPINLVSRLRPILFG